MSPAKLTQDERELLDSYEQDEWEPVDNLELEKKRYQSYAQAAFRKDAAHQHSHLHAGPAGIAEASARRRHPIPDADCQCAA